MLHGIYLCRKAAHHSDKGKEVPMPNTTCCSSGAGRIDVYAWTQLCDDRLSSGRRAAQMAASPRRLGCACSAVADEGCDQREANIRVGWFFLPHSDLDEGRADAA